jgi:signal transduction histidine kinase
MTRGHHWNSIGLRDISQRVQTQTLGQPAAGAGAQRGITPSLTVAHDLKNPINLILGFSQILYEEYATMPQDELRRYLQIVAQNSVKLGSIIDELLLLAGVRQMDVEMEPLDMGSIVAEAQQRLVI